MKKIIYIISITFLTLQSCSSGGDSNTSSNDDNTLLMRKWYVNNSKCSNGNRNYHEFTEPNIYRHYVYPSSNNCNYILPEYGTWTKKGITIIIKYDKVLGIADTRLTVDKLTATTFSFVADGGFGGYHVLSSF